MTMEEILAEREASDDPYKPHNLPAVLGKENKQEEKK